MELCFTDRDLLVGDAAGALLSVLDYEAVPDGMPFVLDGDGSYCWELNRFLRELPGLSVHSRESWRAYARDVVTWGRFLSLRRGKGLWEATKEDVVAFHRVRRVVDPTAAVKKDTWNRSVAALDKLYRPSTPEAVPRGKVARLNLGPNGVAESLQHPHHRRSHTFWDGRLGCPKSRS